MKIHFKIPYYTHWGQQVFVCGNLPELGNNVPEKSFQLHFQNTEDWYGEIEIHQNEPFELEYRYLLYEENTKRFTYEWIEDRKITIDPAKMEHVFCFDFWNAPGAVENVFFTAPFKKVFFSDNFNHSQKTRSKKNFTHIFRIKAPLLKNHQVPCLIGDCKVLGSWNTVSPLLLTRDGENWWKAEVDLGKEKSDVHYKYGIYDTENGQFLMFENGFDRTAPVFNAKNTFVRLSDGFLRMNSQSWKGAGVSIPVFSLRTKESFGVGDFGDIRLLVDWAEKAGLKLIQVLPLNDTIGTHTDADILPYAAISAFALNPLYLNLPSLGKLPENHPLQKEYEERQPQLNALEWIDFLEVVNFKLKYVKALFSFHQEEFLQNKDFLTFFENNKHWLIPYAAFCVLRDRYGTPDYHQWKEFSTFNAEKIAAFVSANQPHYADIALNYFIQYHLHIQLMEAASYAHQHGIVLKGDIPIGVNKNSVETWAHPELFHIDMQAGAPPDMFSIKGQNWELPTYNWEAIKQTGFDWWKKRLKQMSNYFDAFRIDHILGFFRIWEIPNDQLEGIMGHLYPSIPVYLDEFKAKGIWFDYNRFCKPFINDQVLEQLFGTDAGWVKVNCLQIEDGWILRLKPFYRSQKNVQQLYEEGQFSENIRNGLFDLISNVLFFEVEGSHGTRFYPRWGMHSLSTFQYLDDFTKQKLDEIYIDYFYHRQDEFWFQSGMEKLPVLKQTTDMLICGEDLGMMTPCVTRAMKELGILSLEIQRAPKTNKIEFFHPSDAPYLSVVTPSTHDMSTIRGWWEEDRNITQRFYNTQLGHWGEAPYFCEWWICRDILLQHVYSPAIWAIFQIQDLLGVSEKLRRENPHEERINVPSDSKKSWRYRLHLNLEDLLKEDDFNRQIRNYIRQAGR